MRIDLAVYTGGADGYAWFGAYAKEDLVAYKRVIGQFPNPDYDEIPFGGVFNEGDRLVFYRYHVARKGGNQGRDAIYLVMGRVPLANAGDVDFKCAFALDELTRPIKPPPVETTYFGPKASVLAPDFLSQRRFSGTDSLSFIGRWFATMPNGRLKVAIAGNYANPVLNVRFERAAEPVPTVPPQPVPQFGGGVGATAPSRPGGSPFSDGAYRKNPSLPMCVCMILAGLSFVLGCVSGYWLRGFRQDAADLGEKVKSTVTELTGYDVQIRKVESAPRELQATNQMPVKPTSPAEELKASEEPQDVKPVPQACEKASSVLNETNLPPKARSRPTSVRIPPEMRL